MQLHGGQNVYHLIIITGEYGRHQGEKKRIKYFIVLYVALQVLVIGEMPVQGFQNQNSVDRMCLSQYHQY